MGTTWCQKYNGWPTVGTRDTSDTRRWSKPSPDSRRSTNILYLHLIQYTSYDNVANVYVQCCNVHVFIYRYLKQSVDHGAPCVTKESQVQIMNTIYVY